MTTTAADVQAETMAAIRAQLPACRGCGLTYASGDAHRPDCTVEPSPLMCDGPDCDAIRLPSERGAVWQYDARTRTYLCPTHQQGTAA